MDDVFCITGFSGKNELEGEISVKGAKNAALKAMAASILFKDTLQLENIPDIEDIERMHELLEDVGATVKKEDVNSCAISVPNNAKTELSSDIAKRFRGSVVLVGPILSRFGSVSLPYPGGCVIGKRPIDIFLNGFRKMGASVEEDDDCYKLKAPKDGLVGADIFFRVPSVTATETFMMAALLAHGITRIRNAALEPEIYALAEYLKSCGAKIQGVGTTTIEVEGGGLLESRGRPFATPSDRIEAGSFIILAALAGRDVNVLDCEPMHLEALLEALGSAGVNFTIGERSVRVTKNGSKHWSAVDIKTHEYPGFPTDLQAPMSVFLTQCEGEAMVHETIFEGRLHYAEELTWMGADIRMLDPHRMLIKGPTPLRRRELKSPDLRAGIAYVIAGIIADGCSTIHNVYNIDRGYERLAERLSGIGADIKREQQ